MLLSHLLTPTCTFLPVYTSTCTAIHGGVWTQDSVYPYYCWFYDQPRLLHSIMAFDQSDDFNSCVLHATEFKHYIRSVWACFRITVVHGSNLCDPSHSIIYPTQLKFKNLDPKTILYNENGVWPYPNKWAHVVGSISQVQLSTIGQQSDTNTWGFWLIIWPLKKDILGYEGGVFTVTDTFG